MFFGSFTKREKGKFILLREKYNLFNGSKNCLIVDISLTTTNKKFKFKSKEDTNQFISATKKLLASKLTLCFSKIKKTLKNSNMVKQVGGTLKTVVSGTLKTVVSGTIIKLFNQGINKLGQTVSKVLHLP